LVLSLAIATICSGQQDAGQLSARTLFYREQPDNDQLPAPKAVKAVSTAAERSNTPAKPPVSAANTNGSAADTAKPPGPLNAAAAPVVPVVQHLGLRYNVLAVNSANGAAEAADPDRVFNSGECIALEFEPNRSGYLYVFEQGSSGQWRPLFPSTLLANESNVVRSRTPIRVPANDCFELSGPAGQERVFVVLSRNPEDLYAMNDSMRAGSESGAPAQVDRPAPNQTVLVSQNSIGDQIGRMTASLQGRDMALKKVAQPETRDERANTVYVVNAAQTPSDRIVTEIHLSHK
jgi:hypothetical protein